MEQEKLYFFYHIAKTGGRSLIKHFAKTLEPHREFVHLGGSGQKEAKVLGLPEFEDRPPETRDAAQVLMGHHLTRRHADLIQHQELLEITFLRDPASRWVSAYNQAMRTAAKQGHESQPFDDWYGNAPKNAQVRFLRRALGLKNGTPDEAALEELQGELQEFMVVGVLARMDEIAPLLFEQVGLPPLPLKRKNVSAVKPAKAFSPSEDRRQAIEDENPLDLELFHYWEARQEEVVKRLRDSLA